MKNLALLIAAATLAATVTPASASDTSVAGCPENAQHGLFFDPEHPLMEGFSGHHVTGFWIGICAHHPSGDMVTVDQAIDAARTFLKDNNLDCDYVDARREHDGEHKREGEWTVHMECKYAASPLIPPFVPPPPLKDLPDNP